MYNFVHVIAARVKINIVRLPPDGVLPTISGVSSQRLRLPPGVVPGVAPMGVEPNGVDPKAPGVEPKAEGV